MRTIQGVRIGWLLGALGACALWAGAAQADVATERPGSILIFPKVVCDGTRDTVIQVTNTGNLPNATRCFYVDGHAGRNGAPVCTETDFLLNLTKQQPTHWRACQGRRIDPTSPFGSEGAGLDPGLVPAVGVGFTGGLVCLEIDQTSLLPVGQNKLKGEATLEGFIGNAANESHYNAVAVPGLTVGMDNSLLLNNSEYGACPNLQILNYIPDGAPDPVIEDLGNGGLCSAQSNNPGAACNTVSDCGNTGTCVTGLSSVTNRLTLIPCNLDFENAIYSGVQLSFEARDEFENLRSGSTTLPGCWGSFNLADIPGLRFGGAGINTQYATVRITPTAPFVGVTESLHQDSRVHAATAANNLHTDGTTLNATIRLSAP